jgi:hypothetical protein
MRILILLLMTAGLAIGCREPSNNIGTVLHDTTQYEPKASTEIGYDIEIKIDKKEETEETGCEFEDGTHAATVNYYNPQTGHTAKYELEVQVEDCKVVQIDFPNGGWLDEDHIPATEINDTGDAALKDDKGRDWKIHLH